MFRRAIILAKPLRDGLNAGSSMTLGSKGSKKMTEAHRRRMPWAAAKEGVASVVLNTKDKTILEGKHIIEADDIDRMSQADPLDVLKAAVATYHYNTSTGSNVFQLASQLKHDGRGQRFYRKEWMEGTYEKYVTLSSIEFNRDGLGGTAYGYVTFHGESTVKPVEIDHASIPGWHVLEYSGDRAVPPHRIVSPPPSIGTEIPVDPKQYRLKAYPYYDAPNPEVFVEKLLRDRGVLPDAAAEADGTMSASGVGNGANDGSVHHQATA